MPNRFLTSTRGATTVELSILAPIFFVGLIGVFDLGAYFWRWNQAVEAARIGARIAALSDPVAPDLSTMTGLETGVLAGEPAGAYERNCTSTACSAGGHSAAALQRIFYGPGGATCAQNTTAELSGMCDILPTLRLQDVSVTYRSSGVDAAGTPGALRPLVSVRVAGAVPGLVLIDRLVPGGFAALPTAEVTVLAEDLRSAA